jgi:tetratricopeptide (TPR) repeat protein
VRPPAEGSASSTWRRAVDQATDPHSTRERPAWEPERWESEPVRAEAEHAVARGTTRRPAPAPQAPTAPRRFEPARPPAPRKGLPQAEAARLEQRLRDASKAFERERYDDARRILKPLADRMPGSAAVRELLGLTYYRQGRWRDAVRELEAFRGLTGSSEQNPVLADSYRALRRFDEADALWEELRASSPSAELVTEGRIVAAGSLADRGRVPDAIRLLERAPKPPKRPRQHHLRLWYALADLYERAGDIPRARQLFTRLADADPAFADVADRVRTLD